MKPVMLILVTLVIASCGSDPPFVPPDGTGNDDEVNAKVLGVCFMDGEDCLSTYIDLGPYEDLTPVVPPGLEKLEMAPAYIFPAVPANRGGKPNPWDPEGLYVGVTCDNPLQKRLVTPKVRNHDGPVHTDESVELFLSSDAAASVYYHFKLSCFGVKAEQRFIEGARELATWNQPWRSATTRTDEGWTAEVAIPPPA